MNIKFGIKDRRVVLVIFIVFSTIVMSLISPYFFTQSNLLSLLRYTTVVGLLALSQTPLIIGGSGGIDLSVGSVLSLCSVIFGTLAVGFNMNPWLAALLTILFGSLLGLINGLFVTLLSLPPLIVTLATLYLYASLALVISGGRDINGFDKSNFSFLGQSSILGIPVQILFVLLPVYIFGSFLMNRTVFGRNVYAIGSSPEAAKLAGINVKFTRILLFVFSSSVASVGAIVTASWLLNARSTAGSELLLPSITIAVLGGVIITGGIGRVSGTFLALLLVAILTSGMQLAGINSTFQIGLMGFVLIVSILIRSKEQSKIMTV
jgi:ribose/xylose/arabinose/galactoside ABC-type transport system permease subunit